MPQKNQGWEVRSVAEAFIGISVCLLCPDRNRG